MVTGEPEMLIYQKSVFAAYEEENMSVIANTVNTKGVMGAGLALEFRLRYPEYFEDYRKRCLADSPQPGDAWFCPGSGEIPGIVSLFVKDDWRKPTKPEWIRESLHKLLGIIRSEHIERIAVPLAGAGKGGIKPKVSLSMTEETMRCSQSEVFICLDKLPSLSEANMLSTLHSLDLPALQKLGLTRTAASKVIESLKEVTRFREILSQPGVGIKSYELLFKSLIVRAKPSSNQLHLF